MAKQLRSMFGSITDLGDGRFRVRWPESRGADGKRRQPEKTIRGTRANAERYLAKMRLMLGGEGAPFSGSIRDYWEYGTSH